MLTINRFFKCNESLWQFYALLILHYAVSVFCLFEESVWYDYIILISTSSFIAIVEWGTITLFPAKVRKILFAICYSIYLMGLLVQLYLEYEFQQHISFSTYILLHNTHIDEIKNFLQAYANPGLILFLPLTAFAFTYIINKVSRTLQRLGRIFSLICYGFAAIGGCFMIFCVVSLRFKAEAFGITKYSIIASLSSYVSVMSDEQEDIAKLVQTGSRVGDVKCNWKDRPNVVLVIGESCSIFHCSLYGYEKKTCPNMEKWKDRGNLLVFNDAVSITDFTLTAMESIYTLETYKVGQFYNYTLFPYVFKKAGYDNVLFDNQYFIGEENTFMADLKLSESMFNQRNSKRYKYDGEMVNALNLRKKPSLYIIHLYGQHYTYSERYPSSFIHFNADQYNNKRWSKNQREVISHYDNATRYFDYVCNQIIEKFKGSNSCIVIMSDHGEEVYEISSFMGHGTTMTTKDKNYQLRVPFAIFYSDEYKRLHPDIVEKTTLSLEKKVLTDDVSQLLLEIGGVDCDLFNPERSVINELYQEKNRVVLDGVNFDEKI